MNAKRISTLIYLLAVIAVAGALKWHYSTANVNELRWILAPTAALVQIATGTGFEFESFAGYMSADRTFLIAAPCAGVNFLIVCFLMLAVRNNCEGRLIRLPSMLLIAYGWTVIANAARIAIALHSAGAEDLGDAEERHRIEGIIVYFAFLIGLYMVANKFGRPRTGARSGRIVISALLPLLAYYAVALGVPLLNGSYAAAKTDHFISVLLVPLLVWIPFALLAYALAAKESDRKASPDQSDRKASPDQAAE